MKVLVFSLLLIGSHAVAAQESASVECPPKETVFKCENIISSQVSGRVQDKVTEAKFRVWLEEDGLRVQGAARWSEGSGGSPPDRPLSNASNSLSNQKLKVTECEWRVSETFTNQVTNSYPNYPKGEHDYYRMDLKNLELSGSMTTGLKSFSTFKVSCVKEQKEKE